MHLTLCTPRLAQVARWEVDQSDPMGSDHFLIITTLQMTVQPQVHKPIPRWNYQKANWESFKEILINVDTKQLQSNDIDKYYEDIIKFITKRSY